MSACVSIIAIILFVLVQALTHVRSDILASTQLIECSGNVS